MGKMDSTGKKKIEKIGVRMTYQKRLVLQVLQDSSDHPDVETLYARAKEKDSGISIATIYRTVRTLKDAGLLESHNFQNEGKIRYEVPKDKHGHLVNLNNDEIVEFSCDLVGEELKDIAENLGYELKDYRVEIYATKKDS